MALTVYWTRFAEFKLEDIFEYFQAKASFRIARKIVSGIITKTIDLEKTPLMGQLESTLINRPQGFRYLIYKQYKIIYWINEQNKRIEIVNVFDCRQNPEKLNSIGFNSKD